MRSRVRCRLPYRRWSGIEHVLVEPGTATVTGIIDWSDAAMVDPAYDVGLLYRDLGPVALDALLRSGVGANDAGIRERASSTRGAASWRILPTDVKLAGRNTWTRVSPHSARYSGSNARAPQSGVV